ncbi:MAG: nucleotide 5'-monophosphate nucleosidase PpnN [bacterium]
MDKIPHAVVHPINSLNLLSRAEIDLLSSTSAEMFKLFRSCSLAILNTDSQVDDAEKIHADFSDFDIALVPQSRGLRIEVKNAPAQSFVDGVMIRGIQEHLFSALRDVVFTHFKLPTLVEKQPAAAITDTVFRILRNANVVRPDVSPKTVVCWGGHSIPRHEYDYAKQVGYELGLRGLDIVTGCGIGAMKGPMKGAALGHAKQQIKDGRYIGISEPGIIASESPNAIVNELVIMPDIEKRLEAFVRLAHTIIVFPGGVGTVEEILYLLAILVNNPPDQRIPLIFAGPEQCRDYFDELETFIVSCLGEEAKQYYQVIVGSEKEVGYQVRIAVDEVHARRRNQREAYYFNWELEIDESLTSPFIPSHANMVALNLHRDQPVASLASQLRCAFSGFVAGNVKRYGIQQVREHGPYRIHGDPAILEAMDRLLNMMVSEQRMKIGQGTGVYTPCYRLA